MAQNYRELVAWQKAMDLAAGVYEISKCFPPDERFGLTAQIRRAAVSIASNIAEGQGRGSDADFVRFLRIAYGSLREVETQLLLSLRLGFTTEDAIRLPMDLCAEFGRLLNGLMKSKGAP
jgi:four helix bundle protein